MKTTLSLIIAMGIFNFTGAFTINTDLKPKELNPTWYIVNDGVMGGLSNGMYQSTENQTGIFKGMLSLENNGGFSWLKSRAANWELEGYTGIKIKVRGDGRKYAFTLKDGDRGRVLYFASFFETQADEWLEIKLPFEGFKGYYYGQNVNPVTRMNLSLMSELGIILLDKKQGAFQIEIGKIETY